MCRDQCYDTARQEICYFFHLFFRFWFEVGVGLFARYLVRAKKSFVGWGQWTPSFRRHMPPRFEVRCVQMAKAAARVRSLYATSARHQLRDRLVKRSWQHGKRAALLGCLLPMRVAFRYAPRP